MENNKNLWVLPTDKPSRLYQLKIDRGEANKHIYITNDEIVTEYSTDLYFIDVYTNTRHIFSPIYINKDTIAAGKFHTYMNDGDMCKKIILTTDQDLIKDGVQAIDDEFLEWFVKNPSCEEVEVKSEILYEHKDTYRPYPSECKNLTKTKVNYYLSIIPKEEPKQNLKEEMFDLEKEMFELEQERERGIIITNVNKQETLEEVAEKYVNSFEFGIAHPRRVAKKSFINGAKWQKQRSYSEEEVLKLLINFSDDRTFLKKDVAVKWFEQIKKK